MRNTVICFAFLAAACCPAVWAQEKPGYVQQFCVKAVSGQEAAIEAMLPDVSKLMQVRVDEGGLAWYAALRAVIPAGTSARCDYIFTYGYNGYPPEPLTRAQAESAFQKANIGGTLGEMMAKRDRSMTLVSDDLLRVVPGGMAGPASEKGNYVRVNLHKLKPGHTLAEWTKVETEGWAPYAAALAKERAGYGWRAQTLVMPTGVGLPYSAITVDIIPDWAATGAPGSAEAWKKVHPDLTPAAYAAKVAEVCDRYKVELYRNVASVRKK
jgi:hypothetical protein